LNGGNSAGVKSRFALLGLAVLLALPASLYAEQTRAKSAAKPEALAETDPLTKLKQRSAADRWSAAVKRWREEQNRRDAEQKAAKTITIPKTVSKKTGELIPAGNAEQQPIRVPAPKQPESETIIPVPAPPAELVIDPLPQTAEADAKAPTDAKALVPSPAAEPLPDLDLPETPQADAALSQQSTDEMFRDLLPAQVDGDKNNEIDRTYKNIQDVSDLKKITAILPYANYEPDPEIRKDDSCRYLCPKPDGLPCKDYECPKEIKLTDAPFESREFGYMNYHWLASNQYHNPLYFEDVSLERYGHSHHDLVQPFVSVGKFGTQLIGLPYQMAINPIHRKQYTLGWYRPGDWAPKKFYQIPLNLKAAAVQAGVTTGAVFLFP